MSGCAELVRRWEALREECAAAGARLLAVSKYTGEADVDCLARAGQRDFGESRPQALRDRARAFPELSWHMVGPLQRNKAKYVGRHAAVWHSLEDYDVAAAVARHVGERRLPALIQVNVAAIGHGHGVAPDAVGALLERVATLPGIEVRGLMCMAPREGDARAAFRRLARLREELGRERLPELCMGMSGDYRVALEEGATMVRLGTALFQSVPGGQGG